MTPGTELAAKVAMLADRHDKALALIRDIATDVPREAGSDAYGQTAAGIILKCRVFLGLEPPEVP